MVWHGRLRQIATLAAGLALTLLGLSPAHADRFWPLYGARGDAQVNLQCPDGEALVGFAGRGGLFIDQVQIYCARLLHDGTFGAPHPEGMPVGGSGGGRIHPRLCPQNARMIELAIRLGEDGKQVDSLAFACMDMANNVTWHDFKASGQGASERRHTCPQAYFTGIGVNVGRHVNAAGAICEPLTRPAPPAPPNQALKSLGARPKPSAPAIAPPSAIRGTWDTRTNSSGYFTVILNPEHDGTGPLALTPIRVNGHFINQQGANQYDGTLQGLIQPRSRTLEYTYVQKNGASGTGVFTLSNDGNSLTGSGKTSDGTSFTWNGTRSQNAR